jgi:DNA primase
LPVISRDARRGACGPARGRHADELCVTELASLVWAVQMSTVEFHPWNSRRADTERPDEWRIDLDAMPRCEFATVCPTETVHRPAPAPGLAAVRCGPSGS